ncbi:MAG: rod shape-determining protein MreD [Sedimentibacter sp.]|uniref:rod shape-determining protein MreD n=1 Tax=Sedimentibacter sp. TaxID=1960295 RepID=UPI0029828641|nr:rod shape-determining protein MreD [Sedimentibacter sp.]MDW5300199.1 rod shape-determining protein MreD [Sedimentibacter sp.]
MKKLGTMTAIVVVSFVFQTSLFNFFDIFGTVPNISLILVVVFAMMSDGVTGGIVGIITGVLYDAMIYDVFGIYTLIYFIIGSVIGCYNGDMLSENNIAYCTITAVSTVAMHLFMYLILFFLKYRVEYAGSIISSIFLEVVINTILVVFVVKFIIFIFNKLNVK